MEALFIVGITVYATFMIILGLACLVALAQAPYRKK